MLEYLQLRTFKEQLVTSSAVHLALFNTMAYIAGLHILALATVALASPKAKQAQNIGILHVCMMILWFMAMTVGAIIIITEGIYDGTTVVTCIMGVVSCIVAFGLHKLTEKYGTPASRK